jgi:hypothetical protein
MSLSRKAAPAVLAAARAAAEGAADLKHETDRIDPYIPLAAYPGPLQDLVAAIASVANGLYRTAGLATDVIGPDPALPEPGAVPGKLAVASARASGAADQIGAALVAIRRDLRKTGTSTAADPSPLSRRAAIAFHDLNTLDDALRTATRSGCGTLADLDQLTGHQVIILTSMSCVCERFGYGVAEAYERMPGSIARKAARATGPFRRAAATLRKAAAVTQRAHGTLTEEHAQAHKATQAGRWVR